MDEEDDEAGAGSRPTSRFALVLPPFTEKINVAEPPASLVWLKSFISSPSILLGKSEQKELELEEHKMYVLPLSLPQLKLNKNEKTNTEMEMLSTRS